MTAQRSLFVVWGSMKRSAASTRFTVSFAILTLAACRDSSAPAPMGAPSITAGVSAQIIDQDEFRTSPVPHRFVHGRLGDAEFQLCLPADWNGKLVLGSRGIAGDENSFNAQWKVAALVRGFAWGQSDEGWKLNDIGIRLEDRFDESTNRTIQLRGFARGVIEAHYRVAPYRTLILGYSNGGHHAKWLIENHANLFDGGVALAGFNSRYEVFRGWALFGRTFDILAPRIDAIVAKRNATPDWNHRTEPLDPPLTAAQLDALDVLYGIPARLRSGFTFNIGQTLGSEPLWRNIQPLLLRFVRLSLPNIDPTFDPNGDGVVTDDEAKLWDPAERPVNIQVQLRRRDLTGNVTRPLVIGHGTIDPVVSPGESVGYKALADQAGASEMVRVFPIPGMGHSGVLMVPWQHAALEAIDSWLDTGTPPSTVLGQPPLPAGSHPAGSDDL